MNAEQLVTWIVGAVLGVVNVPIVQWLKKILGVEDKIAFLVVMLASIVLAVGAMAATGGFSPFGLSRLFEYLAAIVTLSQFTYRLFVKA